MPERTPLGTLAVGFAAEIRDAVRAVETLEKRLVAFRKRVAETNAQAQAQPAEVTLAPKTAGVNALTGAVRGLSAQIKNLQNFSSGLIQTLNRLDQAAASASQSAGRSIRQVADDIRASSGAIQRFAIEFAGPNGFLPLDITRGGTTRRVARPPNTPVASAGFVPTTGATVGPEDTAVAPPVRRSEVGDTGFVGPVQARPGFASNEEQLAQIGQRNARIMAEIQARAEQEINARLVQFSETQLREQLDARFRAHEQFWKQINVAVANIVKQTGQLTSSQLTGGIGRDEADQIKRNIAAFKEQERALQEAQQGRGALGIPQTGNLFNRLFGNFIESLKTATSLLLRFEAARVVIGGITTTFNTATDAAIGFDDAIAKLAAISGESNTSISALADAAREVGRTSIISATEAANGLQLLAQAGFSVKESIDALPATLALAVGGVSTLEQSTQILTSAIRAFGLDASQANEISNIFVATVNKSKSSIEDLNTAFNFAGTTAAEAGLTVRDLAAIVGTLADNGVRASTQGTAVRQAIGQLINPSEKAQKVFERLGVSLDDINPLFNDIVTVFDRLRDAGFNISDAFEAFDKRVAPAISLLVTQGDRINTLRERVTGTSSAFDAMTRRQESLSAKTTILTNNFRDLAIEAGENLIPAAKGVVTVLTTLLDVFSAFPAAVSGIGFGAVAFGAVQLTRGLVGFVNQAGRSAQAASAVALGLHSLGASIQAGQQAAGSLVNGISRVPDAMDVAAIGVTGFSGAVQGMRAVLLSIGPQLAIFAGLAALGTLLSTLQAKGEERRRAEIAVTETVIEEANAHETLINQYEDALTALNNSKVGTDAYAEALNRVKLIAAELITQFPELTEELNNFAKIAGTSSLELLKIRKVAELGGLQARIDTLQKERDNIALSSSNDPHRNAFLDRARLKELDQQIAALRESVAEKEQLLETQGDFSAGLRRTVQEGNLPQALLQAGERAKALATSFFPQLEEFQKADAEGKEKFKQLADQIGRGASAPDSRLLSEQSIKTFVEGIKLKLSPETFKKVTEELDTIRSKTSEVVLSQAKNITSAGDAAGEATARLHGNIDKLRKDNAGLDAEIDAANKGLSRTEQLRARAAAEFDQATKKINKEFDKKLTDAGIPPSQRESTLPDPETGIIPGLTAKQQSDKAAAIKIRDEKLTQAELQRNKKLKEAQKADIEEVHQAQQTASADRIRTVAEEEARVLEAEGKELDAIHRRFEGERQAAAAKSKNAQALGAEIGAINEREKLAIQEKQEQILQRILEIREKTHQITLKDIQDEARFKEQLLDIEAEKVDRGQTGEGRAQGRERIERARLQLKIESNTNEITFQRQSIVDRETQLQGKKVELTELEKQKLAEGTEEAAQRVVKSKTYIETLEKANAESEAGIKANERDNVILGEKLKLIQKAGEASINFGDSIAQGIDDAFQGVILGTSKGSELFKNFGNSLFKQITGAFAKVLVEKLGFDKTFVLNMEGLGGQTQNILGGAFSSVFSFAGSLLGGFGNAFVNVIGGLAGSVGSLFGKQEVDITGNVVGGAAPGTTSPVPNTPAITSASPVISQGQAASNVSGLSSAVSLAQIFNSFQSIRRPIGSDFGRSAALKNFGLSVTKGLASFALPSLAPTLSKLPLLGGLFKPFVGAALPSSLGFLGPTAARLPNFAATTAVNVAETPATAAGAELSGGAGAGAGAGLVSTLSTVISVVGALASITQAAVAINKSSQQLKKITRGAHEATNLQIAGNVGLALGAAGGAGIGAAVGTAAFPGIGTVAGAAIGATIGATISQLIHATIAAAVGGNTAATIAQRKQIKTGINQAQFRKSIASDTGIKLLFGDGGNAQTGGPGNKFGGGFAAPIAGQQLLDLFIPSIDQIMKKIFVEVIKSAANIDVDRHLATSLGGGLRGPAKDRAKEFFGPKKEFPIGGFGKEEGPLRETTQGAARLISGVIGAGSENEKRVREFFLILANSVASNAKTLDKAQTQIFRIIRHIAGPQFVQALTSLQNVLRAPFDKGPSEKFLQSFHAVTAAFKTKLPTLNLDSVGQQLIEGEFLRDKKAVKQSKKLVKESAGELIATDDFDTNFSNFTKKLADGVQEALQSGLINALVVQGPVGVALARLFHVVNRGIKKALKDGGVSPQEEISLNKKLQDASAKTKRLLVSTRPELERVFKEIQEILKPIQEIKTDKQLKKEQQQESIDKNGLISQLRGTIEGLVARILDLTKGLYDAIGRLGQKIFDAARLGVPDTEAATAPETVAAARTAVTSVRSKIDEVDLKSLRPDAQISALGVLENAVDNFVQTATQAVQQQYQKTIEIAKAAKSALEGVTSQLLSLRTTKKGSTPEDRLAAVQKELVKQRQVLLTGKPEDQLKAGQRIQELDAQLLEVGRENLDVTGPAFRSLEREVEQDLVNVSNLFSAIGAQQETAEAAMNAALTDIGLTAKSQYEYIRDNLTPTLADNLFNANETLLDVITAINGGGDTSVKDAIEKLPVLTKEQLQELTLTVQDITAKHEATPTPDPGDSRAIQIGGPDDKTPPNTTPPTGGPTTHPVDRPADPRPTLLADAHALLAQAITLVSGAPNDKPGQFRGKVESTLTQAVSGIQADIRGALGTTYSEIETLARDLSPWHWTKPKDNPKADILGFLQQAQRGLPRAALGGFTNHHQQFIAGEAGGEAIVPLNSTGIYQFLAVIRQALNGAKAPFTNLIQGGQLGSTQGLENMIRLAANAAEHSQARVSALASQARQAPTTIHHDQSSASSTEIKLNIMPGAFAVTVDNASPDQAKALTKQMMEELIYQIKRGKVGKVIKEKVNA